MVRSRLRGFSDNLLDYDEEQLNEVRGILLMGLLIDGLGLSGT